MPAQVAKDLISLLRGDRALSGDAHWREALAFADRNGCALLLRSGAPKPQWFEQAIEQRFEKNLRRRVKLRADYDRVAEALSGDGIPFALLKGFTHESGWGIEGAARVQYDLDLLCLASQCGAAFQALEKIGYRPHGRAKLSNLHERPMVRPSNWQWTGDYYDPEMPVPVEVHTRLWNGAPDRLPVEGLDSALARRVELAVEGHSVPALREVDRIAFAALHVLQHALHNNARASHVWELARMLDARSRAVEIWNEWQGQPQPLRLLETIGFRFAREWFGCAWPDAVEEEWVRADASVRNWFREFAFSPLDNLVQPNKDIVWLHRALVEGRLERLRLVASRLVPLKAPRDLGRVGYHARALARAWIGFRRWQRTASITVSETSD